MSATADGYPFREPSARKGNTVIKGTVNASNISIVCANGERKYGPDKRFSVAEISENAVELAAGVSSYVTWAGESDKQEYGHLVITSKQLQDFIGKDVKVLIWVDEG